MFINNLSILIKFTGISQKSISEEIGFSETAFSKWKAGNVPHRNTLKRLAKYFSEKCNIPYDVFQDGQALLTDDFEAIIKNLSKTDNSGTNYSIEHIKLEEHEKNYIITTRKILNNTPHISCSKTYLEKTARCHAITGGDESFLDAFLQMVETFRK